MLLGVTQQTKTTAEGLFKRSIFSVLKLLRRGKKVKVSLKKTAFACVNKAEVQNTTDFVLCLLLKYCLELGDIYVTSPGIVM